MKKVNVAIIGFGEVGSTVAVLINSSLTTVNFSIYDPNPLIYGKYLDFSHACAVQENDVSLNHDENLNCADYIIYCAGHSNQKGESRESVAEINKQMLQFIFDKSKIKKETKFIVVTNPVEKITKCLQEIFPKNNVVGTGTSLDTFRLNWIVSQKLNLPISSVKSLVIGEHGQFMTAIFSKSFINNTNFLKFYSEQELFELSNELKNMATKIRETEKATKFGVAECVVHVLKAFLGSFDITTPLSVKINDSYSTYFQNHDSNLVLSLPCQIIKGELSILNFTDFSENELKNVKKAIENYKK